MSSKPYMCPNIPSDDTAKAPSPKERTEVAIGHCKDCKSWGEINLMFKGSWNECTAADQLDRSVTLPENGLAVYAEILDDHGLETGLRTGPMFGCVKFQQRL